MRDLQIAVDARDLEAVQRIIDQIVRDRLKRAGTRNITRDTLDRIEAKIDALTERLNEGDNQ